MNIERLQLMSDMLSEVIAGTWQPTSDNLPKLRDHIPVRNIAFELRSWFGVTPDYCGYSACAIGHACMDDRFNHQGLVFGLIGPEYITDEGYKTSWQSVEAFFDISNDMARGLFNSSSYFDLATSHLIQWQRDGSQPPVSPAQVKARVDQLILKGVA